MFLHHAPSRWRPACCLCLPILFWLLAIATGQSAESPASQTEPPAAKAPAAGAPASDAPAAGAVTAPAPPAEAPQREPAGNVGQPTPSPSQTPAKGQTAPGTAAGSDAVEPAPLDAAPPATAEATQPPPMAGEPPDYERLADPEVAEALKLSRDQRDRIAELLAARAQKLAEAADATDAERNAIVQPSDEKLGQVLTEVQRGDFLGKPVSRRLQFMFRYQRWADVLEWFAEQADLSLVLDAPPPGTFNYIDSREYTPDEAIDLLNSVLITKGYTLIRRGRMLMVIDLSEGIPEGLVPQCSLEDLDRHGKFELVTVSFPVGRRTSATVTEAINPLLSPHGKVVPVEATKQVIVTDTAGIMSTIDTIIEAMPEPKSPEPPPKPRPPEYPELKIYPIKSADPDTVLSVLSRLLPEAQLSVDPSTDNLNVYAKPSQQGAVAKVLEQMEGPVPDQKQRTLEVYPIDTFFDAEPAAATVSRRRPAVTVTTSADQLLSTLQTIVPEAQLSVNGQAKTLVAWATPGEHEKISQTLEKLKVERGPRETPQLEVHRLTKADPDATLTLFQAILPDARLAVDPQSRSLIAVAVPTDQEVIRSTLKTLQPADGGPDTPELRFYELTLAMPPDFVEVISKVAPGSHVALEQGGMRLMVIAPPSQHAKVDKAIQNMEKTTFIEGRPKLVFYPVTSDQRRRFDAVWQSLSAELPGVELVTDDAPGELAIWARPHQHEVIAEILDELKREVPEGERNQLVAYPIKSSDPTSVMEMLQTLYPQIKVVLDSATNRLMVWTSPQDHESIKKSLDQMAAASAENQPRYEVYRIHGASTSTLTTTLQTLVPNARISVDPTGKKLVVWAGAEEHERIQGAIDTLLGRDSPSDANPTVAVYPLTKADPTSTVTLLGSLVPDAELSIDSQTGNLVALAFPADHQLIKSTLEQLQPTEAGPNTPVLRFFPLSADPPPDLLTVLQPMVPKAQITLDADNQRLMAVATPDDQTTIETTIQEFQENASEKPVLRFHPLAKEPPANLVTVLQGLVPKAQITLDSENKRLMAVATAEDHTTIEKTIQEFDVGTDGEPTLRFHPLVQEPAADLVSVLQGLVPKAQITLDTENKRLMAVATAEDHETIQKTIEEFEANTPPQEPNKLAVYTVTPEQRQRFEALLSSITQEMPGVQVIAGGEPDELAIWAKPTEHVVLADIINELKGDAADGQERKLAAYAIKSADPQSVLSMLQTLYPNTQFVLDEKAKRLLVWTRPDEHQSIKASLEEIQAEAPAEEQPRFEAFPIPVADSSTIVDILQPLVPNARLTVDTKTKQLIVWGTPAELEIIRKAIERLGGGMAAGAMPQLEVYPLNQVDASATVQLLESLVPDAQFTLDTTANKLMAFAVPADHEAIKATLDKVQGEGSADGRPGFEAYPIHGVRSAADAAQFLAALQPLVPNAKLSIDTEGKNLIAWGTPREQDLIRGAVEKLGQGDSPENTPQLEVYRLTKADPQSALALLQNLLPDAQLSVDPATKSLAALAVPADQQVIKDTLDRMEADGPAEDQPRFETYSIRGTSTAAEGRVFVTTLQPLVPEARLTLDAKGKNLIAWATPGQHETIRRALGTLGQDGSPLHTPQLEVYALTKVDPATALALLQDLLPDAQLTLDPQSKRIVALAVPADQQTIRATLDQLQSDAAGPNTPKLQFHPLEKTPSENLLTVLGDLLPQAQITLDAENKRLSALATPADHDTIQNTIELFEASTADEPQLRFHPLVRKAPPDLMIALQGLAPTAQITLDTENDRLMAVATPADHEVIQSTIAEFESTTPPEEPKRLVVYTVTPAQRRRFESVVATMDDQLDNIHVLTDTQPGQLSVWATPSQHLVIAQIVEQLKGDAPEDDRFQLEVYPLKSVDPQSALSVLERLFPDTEFVVDEKTKRLMVWTTQSEHRQIKAALEQMDTGVPGELEEQFKAYEVSAVDPTVAMQMLQELVQDMRLSTDAATGKILAWGRKSDHQTIAKLLEQMEAEPPEEKKSRVAVYPLESITAAGAMQVLQTAVPKAQFTVDTQDPQRLTAWARPSEHDTIKTILKDIDVEAAGASSKTPVIYSLEDLGTRSFYYAYRFLMRAVPGASFAEGAEEGQLVAWASAKDHQQINNLVDQLTKEPPPERVPRVKIYSLKSISSSSARLFLRDAVPQAEVTIDTQNPQRLTVWARPADHERVESILQEIDLEEAPDSVASVKVYPVKGMTAVSAYVLLRSAVPAARVTYGADPPQLIVWARPADHLFIGQFIDQIASIAQDDESSRTANVYTLESLTATAAMSFLRQVVPQAQLSAGSQTDQLIAWARAEDHQKIQSTLEEIDVEGPEDAQAVVYTLEGMSATTAIYVTRFLQTAIPEARFVQGVEPGQMVAWARPKDHQEIRQLVDQLMQEPPPEKAPKAVVYSLRSIPASSAVEVLQSAVPQATFTVDTNDPQRLTALARSSDHETIDAILQEIDMEGAAESAASVKVYQLDGITAAAAYTLLRTAVPQARVTYGTDPQQVVVWARPPDHELVRQFIDQIAAIAQEEESSRTATVYTLESLTATAAMSFLRQVVPEAQLSAGSQTDQLIAWARAEDHQKIQSTLQEIDVEGPEDTQAVVYTLDGMDARTAIYVTRFLQTAIPEAQFVQGVEPGQMVAWARPKDHEEIARLVDQLTQEPPPEKAPTAVVYDLKSITASSAMQVLQGAVPQATFTADADNPQRLTALARPSEHEAIEGILEDIDVEGDPESAAKVVVYPLEGMETRRAYYAYRFIREAVPAANLTLSSDSTQLIAWARPKDHQVIADLLEQVQHEIPELARRTAVYTLQWMTAANASDILEEILPDVDFSVGDDPQKLIVWARPADHQKIQSTLEQIDVEPSAETASKAVVYSLKAITSEDAIAVLEDAVPEARLNAAEEAQNLVAFARPADHQMIESILQEIDVEEPAETAAKVVAYPLAGMESRRSYYALLFVREAIPDATVTMSSDSSQLIVWAKPKDHQRVAELLEQVLREPPELARRAVVYTLKWITADRASEILEDMLREADFNVGDDPQQLIAFARPAEHEKIQSTLEQIDVEPSAETASKAVVYSLKAITSEDAIAVLEDAVPEARLNAAEEAQNLVAFARPADHQMIEAILQEIDVEEPAETAAKVVAYPLAGMESRRSYYALLFVREAIPDATVTMSSDSSQLIVWAKPKDHQRVAELLEQVLREPPELARRAVVYTLKWITADRASEILEDMLREADFNVGDDPQQLIAFARPAEHEKIQSTLEQIDVEPSAETASKAVVYSLKAITSEDAIAVLEDAVPEARLNAAEEAQNLVAFARPADHQMIEAILQEIDVEEPAETAAKVVAYPLAGMESRRSYYALLFVRDAIPDATPTLSSDGSQLIVWAKPKDHQHIAELLEQVLNEPPELARRTVVYTLRWITADRASEILEDMLREADFNVGEDPQQLIALARPAEHDKITSTLEQIDVEPSPETASKAVVYSLKAISSEDAIAVLEEAVPEATLNAAEDAQNLVAFARPVDHQMIESILQEIDVEEPAETAARVVVYPLEGMETRRTYYAYRFIREAVPEANLTLSSDSTQLIAWARPKDHQVIADLLEQIQHEMPELARRTAVYTLQWMTAENATEILADILPEVDFNVGEDLQQLIAFARPTEHEKIQSTLELIDVEPSPDTASRAVVYALKFATAADAVQVLEDAVADAQFSVGDDPQRLVAWARPADHEMIDKILQQIDAKGSPDSEPSAQVYTLQSAMVTEAMRILRETVPLARLTMGAEPNQLIAWARPADHEVIAEIIDRMTEMGPDVALELYPMKNIDDMAAMEILEDLMDKRGAGADLSMDYRSNQLIAIARPEIHELITDTLDRLRAEEPKLEIYELEYVDPFSAEMAIATQFLDEGTSAPQVDMDPLTQQLFVRASDEQHEAIRELLIKMGENRLALLRGRSTEAMRTIPFQGDVQGAIEQIQRVWPKLRENQIRIVTPATPLPPSPAQGSGAGAGKESAVEPARDDAQRPSESAREPKQGTTELAPAAPGSPPAQSPRQNTPTKPGAAEAKPLSLGPPTDRDPRAADPPSRRTWNRAWQILAQIRPDDPTKARAADPAAGHTISPTDNDAASGNQGQDGAAEPEGSVADAPPIYIVPGHGSLTIVCDDPEALDQFEDLLRTLSPSTGHVGRNISIFELKHSSSAVIAAQLQDLFRDSASSWRRGFGSVSIVPDERLNTVLVQGSRIDRETIEGLVRILDTDEGPASKPVIIPIKNVDAEQIAEVIRNVFRSQMIGSTRSRSSQGTRTASSRFVPEVAVDEGTNSLVVMATSPLLEEITDLANTLDQGAGENPARRLKIIPLEKASASRVEEALDKILQRRSSRSSR